MTFSHLFLAIPTMQISADKLFNAATCDVSFSFLMTNVLRVSVRVIKISCQNVDLAVSHDLVCIVC